METQRKCPTVVDLGFLIDVSGSVKRQFSKMLDLIKRIVDDFGISQSGTHAGAVVFSDFARVVIKFNDYFDVSSFKKALDVLPTPRGGTRIDIALQLAHRDLFSMKAKARDGVPKVLIMLTDGVQTPSLYSLAPEIAVKPLHDIGVQVRPIIFNHQVTGLFLNLYVVDSIGCFV